MCVSYICVHKYFYILYIDVHGAGRVRKLSMFVYITTLLLRQAYRAPFHKDKS